MKRIFIVIGSTEISEEDISSLQKNTLIPFDKFNEVQVFIDGKPIAEGSLGFMKKTMFPYPNYFFLINSPELASIPLLDWTKNIPDSHIKNSIFISKMIE